MLKIVMGVRGVNDAIYREFKAMAIERGMLLGEVLTIAMKRFLKKQASDCRSPSRVHYLDEVAPCSFGAGTERLSELIS